MSMTADTQRYSGRVVTIMENRAGWRERGDRVQGIAEKEQCSLLPIATFKKSIYNSCMLLSFPLLCEMTSTLCLLSDDPFLLLLKFKFQNPFCYSHCIA